MQRENWIPANETHDYVRRLNSPFGPLLSSLKQVPRLLLPSSASPQESPRSTTAVVIQQREGHRLDRIRRFFRHSIRYSATWFARRPGPPVGDWSISTLSRFEQDHEPFIAQAVSQFDFIAERSLAYLNWRYCDPRGGPFTVRLAHRNNQPLGFAVTRIRDGDAGLADILALPGHLDVAESLIRDSIDLAKSAGASSIATRLPKRHPYRPALARAGFFDIGHIAGELVASRGMPVEDLAFLADEDTRIHHVLADADYV